MTTLTIRIDDKLKTRAIKKAKDKGLSLTQVVQNALNNFISDSGVLYDRPSEIDVDRDIKKKMDEVGFLINYC